MLKLTDKIFHLNELPHLKKFPRKLHHKFCTAGLRTNLWMLSQVWSENDTVALKKALSRQKSVYEPKWPIRPELIPVSVALSD